MYFEKIYNVESWVDIDYSKGEAILNVEADGTYEEDRTTSSDYEPHYAYVQAHGTYQRALDFNDLLEMLDNANLFTSEELEIYLKEHVTDKEIEELVANHEEDIDEYYRHLYDWPGDAEDLEFDIEEED